MRKYRIYLIVSLLLIFTLSLLNYFGTSFKIDKIHLRNGEKSKIHVRTLGISVPLAMYKSNQPTKVKVAGNGTIEAIGVGKVLLSARFGLAHQDFILIVEPDIRTLLVSPVNKDLTVGESIKIIVQAKDHNGQLIENLSPYFVSADSSIAFVTKDGLVKAKTPGEAKVIVKLGNLRQIISIRVFGDIGVLSVFPASKDLVVGNSFKLKLEAKDKEGNLMKNMMPTFVSDNPSTVSVTKDGSIFAKKTGEGNITTTVANLKLVTNVRVYDDKLSLDEESSFGGAVEEWIYTNGRIKLFAYPVGGLFIEDYFDKPFVIGISVENITNGMVATKPGFTTVVDKWGQTHPVDPSVYRRSDRDYFFPSVNIAPGDSASGEVAMKVMFDEGTMIKPAKLIYQDGVGLPILVDASKWEFDVGSINE